jgi:hypothetical protein
MTEIQYVSDESGEPTAVIVPVELWREIESEKETAYLLKSENMKRRLLEAQERQTGIPFEEARENLEFDSAAFEDLAWWIQQDRSKALRIGNLIKRCCEIQLRYRQARATKARPKRLLIATNRSRASTRLSDYAG